MYQGTLEAVSNRADWFIDIELVDDDTNSTVTDLTGFTFNFQVRPAPPQGAQGRRSPLIDGYGYYDYWGGNYDNKIVLQAQSGDSHTSVVGGVVEFHFTAQEMSKLVQGSYEVGLTATNNGIVEQEMIVILPVVDGVIRP